MRSERQHPREETLSRSHIQGTGGAGLKENQGSASDTHRFKGQEMGELLPLLGASHFEAAFSLYNSLKIGFVRGNVKHLTDASA